MCIYIHICIYMYLCVCVCVCVCVHIYLYRSVSYGEALAAVSSTYAKRLDLEMQKLAAVGITVVFASGDSGVYSRSGFTTYAHIYV